MVFKEQNGKEREDEFTFNSVEGQSSLQLECSWAVRASALGVQIAVI